MSDGDVLMSNAHASLPRENKLSVNIVAVPELIALTTSKRALYVVVQVRPCFLFPLIYPNDDQVLR